MDRALLWDKCNSLIDIRQSSGYEDEHESRGSGEQITWVKDRDDRGVRQHRGPVVAESQHRPGWSDPL